MRLFIIVYTNPAIDHLPDAYTHPKHVSHHRDPTLLVPTLCKFLCMFLIAILEYFLSMFLSSFLSSGLQKLLEVGNE